MPGQESKGIDTLPELRRRIEREPIASFLKIQLLELSPGYAKVAMKLSPEHQNIYGFVSGGIVMAVADQAFSYATNSIAPSNHPAIASQLNVYFIAGANKDDELIAEGRVVSSGRRIDICEITVTNQKGKLIAKATGTTIPVAKRSG